MTYDATGNMLTKKVYNTGSVLIESRYYNKGFEFCAYGATTPSLELIHHSQGYYRQVTAGVFRHEYVIKDHLGNSRIVYTDADNNGIIAQTSTEILDENHYYAYGIRLNGCDERSKSSANEALDNEGTANDGLQHRQFFIIYVTNYKYKFNGIERTESIGLNIDIALYRGLDPVLGKWYQVDPKAEAMVGMSPYCAMGNNPVMHTDPKGDILPAILLGAAIGLVTNGIGNVAAGNNFFDGAGKAALFGAIGGAVSFGIGSAANSLFGTGASLGKAAFQMGAHGLTGGAMSAAQGGNFTSGMLSGALSSGISSGASAIGVSGWGMVGVGGLAGGVGSSIGGGSFWGGVGQGLITSGLNHAAHSGMFGEGLAVSLVTGKMRHIVGPDAVGLDVGVDAATGGGAHAHKSEVLMLRGSEAGKSFTLDESGIHGGFALGASVGLTRYYYSGSTSQLKHNAFYGRSWTLSLAFGIGVSASYANSTYNNKAYSIGTSFGWSPSILPKWQGTFGPYNTTPSSWSDYIFSY